MRWERSGGDFRQENANKTVCSILTRVPIQVRYGDGGLKVAKTLRCSPKTVERAIRKATNCSSIRNILALEGK